MRIDIRTTMPYPKRASREYFSPLASQSSSTTVLCRLLPLTLRATRERRALRRWAGRRIKPLTDTRAASSKTLSHLEANHSSTLSSEPSYHAAASSGLSRNTLDTNSVKFASPLSSCAALNTAQVCAAVLGTCGAYSISTVIGS